MRRRQGQGQRGEVGGVWDRVRPRNRRIWMTDRMRERGRKKWSDVHGCGAERKHVAGREGAVRRVGGAGGGTRGRGRERHESDRRTALPSQPAPVDLRGEKDARRPSPMDCAVPWALRRDESGAVVETGAGKSRWSCVVEGLQPAAELAAGERDDADVCGSAAGRSASAGSSPPPWCGNSIRCRSAGSREDTEEFGRKTPERRVGMQ